jgi:hypothetical protein
MFLAVNQRKMRVAEYAFGIPHDSAVRFPIRTVFGTNTDI